MSSSSTTNKFNFMTDSFKEEEEKPKAKGEQKRQQTPRSLKSLSKKDLSTKRLRKSQRPSEKATPEISASKT